MMICNCIHAAARAPAHVYVLNLKGRVDRAAFSSRIPLNLRMRHHIGSCVDSTIQIFMKRSPLLHVFVSCSRWRKMLDSISCLKYILISGKLHSFQEQTLSMFQHTSCMAGHHNEWSTQFILIYLWWNMCELKFFCLNLVSHPLNGPVILC